MFGQCTNYGKNKILFIIFSIVISAFIIFMTCYSVAFAEGRPSYSKNAMVKKETLFNGNGVASVNGGAGVNITDVPDNPKQISINRLFGCDDRSFIYRGEVPKDANKWTEGADGKQYLDNTEILGDTRNWTNNPDWVLLGDGNSGHDQTWKDNVTQDLHGRNLLQDAPWYEGIAEIFGNIGFAMCSGLNAVWAKGVDLLIFVANLDVNWIMENIGYKDLANVTSELFLFKDGSPSPVLIIAAILFIISLAIFVIKFVTKGDKPARVLLREFIFLLLAALLAAVCVTGSNVKIIDSLSKASTIFLSAINGSPGSDDSWALFKCESSDSTRYAAVDATNTQSALVSKVYIDMLIRNQFAYTVKELDLWNDSDGNTSSTNWGISKDNLQAIMSRLKGDPGQNPDIFTISTKDSGLTNNKEPNLGYFWYAACADTNPYDPFDVEADGKAKKNSGDRLYASLYIVDFLAAVDASPDIGDSGSAKARKIVEQFRNPARDVGQMFLCSLVTLFTILAIVVSAAYAMIGKVIFNFGVIFIPLIPILLLIPFGSRNSADPGQMRTTAKKLLFTWMIAALKMIIGQVLIILIITFSAMLCESGIFGMFIDCLFLLGMFIITPQLWQKINQVFGRHEIGAMQKINGIGDKVANGIRSAVTRPGDMKDRVERFKDRFRKDGTGAANGDNGKDMSKYFGNKLTNAVGNGVGIGAAGAAVIGKAQKDMEAYSNRSWTQKLADANGQNTKAYKLAKNAEKRKAALNNSKLNAGATKMRNNFNNKINKMKDSWPAKVPLVGTAVQAGLSAVQLGGNIGLGAAQLNPKHMGKQIAASAAQLRFNHHMKSHKITFGGGGIQEKRTSMFNIKGRSDNKAAFTGSREATKGRIDWKQNEDIALKSQANEAIKTAQKADRDAQKEAVKEATKEWLNDNHQQGVN